MSLDIDNFITMLNKQVQIVRVDANFILFMTVLSSAFDNIDSAVKAPSYTPTPCLKIRNMFDLSL